MRKITSRSAAKRAAMAPLDRRTSLGRRVSEVAKELAGTLWPRERLTGADQSELERVALLKTLSEVATRRALAGECSVTDATRAASAARRAEQALRHAIVLGDA